MQIDFDTGKAKAIAIGIMVTVVLGLSWYSSGEYERFVKDKAEKLAYAIEAKKDLDLEAEYLRQKSVHATECSKKYDEYLTKLLSQTGGDLPEPPSCRQSAVPEAYAESQSSTGQVSNDTPSVTSVPKEPHPNQLSSDQLFYSQKVSDKCYVSQTEDSHFMKKNGYVLATDVACNFGEGVGKRAEVYAPDYKGQPKSFTVSDVGEGKLIGKYVKLSFECESDSACEFLLGHTETKLKKGDTVQTGTRIGQMHQSGAWTGWHVHFELWKDNENVSYTTRSQVLRNSRDQSYLDKVEKKDSVTLYATSYDLGDVNQNDASPYTGASGKDLRHVTKPIALTVDMRKALSVSFGDKVRFDNGPCPGIYQVEDEMNNRYRFSCVSKDGACIKADIAVKPGEQKGCSGKYIVTKA